MTDQFDQDLILGYIEGELDDAERAAFEATLEANHELRGLVAQLKIDRQNLRQLSRCTAPVGVVDQAMQSQERDELLGEPEVIQPMPAAVKVDRYKLRRVMFRVAVAAVLIISAALVIPTLIPTVLLDHAPNYAIDSHSSLAPESKTGAVDAGDTVSDALTASKQAGQQVDPRGRAEESSEAFADGRSDPTTLKPEAMGLIAEESLDARRFSGSGFTMPDTADEPADEVAAVHAAPAAQPEVLALGDQPGLAESRGIALGRHAKIENDPADVSGTGELSSIALKDAVGPAENDRLALTEPAETMDLLKEPPVATAATAAPDPFMGYQSTPSLALGEQPELLISTTSPRRARRALRDWALQNQAVVSRVPSEDAQVRRALITDANKPASAGMQLVIELDHSQVDALITHLSRTPSQQAVVRHVTRPDVTLARREASESKDHGSLVYALTTTDGADAEPKALANRYVDTHGSSWPAAGGNAPESQAAASEATARMAGERQDSDMPVVGSALASAALDTEGTGDATTDDEREVSRMEGARQAKRRGVDLHSQAGGSGGAYAGSTLSEREQEADPISRHVTALGIDASANNEASGHSPFDISDLLTRITTQPVEADPPTPLLQPRHGETVRLQVIIQQVADPLDEPR